MNEQRITELCQQIVNHLMQVETKGLSIGQLQEAINKTATLHKEIMEMIKADKEAKEKKNETV